MYTYGHVSNVTHPYIQLLHANKNIFKNSSEELDSLGREKGQEQAQVETER